MKVLEERRASSSELWDKAEGLLGGCSPFLGKFGQCGQVTMGTHAQCTPQHCCHAPHAYFHADTFKLMLCQWDLLPVPNCTLSPVRMEILL